MLFDLFTVIVLLRFCFETSKFAITIIIFIRQLDELDLSQYGFVVYLAQVYACVHVVIIPMYDNFIVIALSSECG